MARNVSRKKKGPVPPRLRSMSATWTACLYLHPENPSAFAGWAGRVERAQAESIEDKEKCSETTGLGRQSLSRRKGSPDTVQTRQGFRVRDGAAHNSSHGCQTDVAPTRRDESRTGSGTDRVSRRVYKAPELKRGGESFLRRTGSVRRRETEQLNPVLAGLEPTRSRCRGQFHSAACGPRVDRCDLFWISRHSLCKSCTGSSGCDRVDPRLCWYAATRLARFNYVGRTAFLTFAHVFYSESYVGPCRPANEPGDRQMQAHAAQPGPRLCFRPFFLRLFHPAIYFSDERSGNIAQHV
jgi:hypothetical protein